MIDLIVLAALFVWNRSVPQTSVQLAVAKSKQMLDMNNLAAAALDATAVQEIVYGDAALTAVFADREVEFVNATPLSQGEARYWQDAGCGREICAHVTFYDYTNGGALEAVVNLDTAVVIAHWFNAAARPGGSTFVLPKALAIAAADAQVRNILGDIGAADPAMVPMSGWLMDDACRDEWCVDLTFHDPSGSGRIFHVFVNMEQEEVARTFYTRGREERAAARPLAQRNAYSDGCHAQYGWEVCWEMTAHDGVNFRDASYNGQLIFTSAKITQVEAWYPSWPGGYRDEIGFNATVPAFGDTAINDLGDSFEVRQLFTEFTRWPNCICCYRYEQIIRFYRDGSFETRFVSHGPGCDDLSVYRPFWRIDLALDGPGDDEVWLWQNRQWVEARTEFETHPVVEDLSPEGAKLATLNNDVSYRWRMERTDPLGLDEAYLWGLQSKEAEGGGPVLTGPGDTYIPPRQWLDGEPLSGENIVLWYVPLLKTKKSSPWWCMPDPEPDYSPCEAILRAERSGPLTQPSQEELAQQPTPTPAPPTPTPAPTPTPRPIEGTTAEEIFLNAGCTSCHQIGSLGEAHKVGPDLSSIGLIAGQRVEGMSAETYIRQSIVEPNAYLAPECPNGPCLANIMPRDYGQRLLPQQIELLVTYLLAQQSPPPTPAPLGATAVDPSSAPKSFPAPKTTGSALGPAPQITPTVAVQIFLLGLVIVLSVYRLLRLSRED